MVEYRSVQQTKYCLPHPPNSFLNTISVTGWVFYLLRRLGSGLLLAWLLHVRHLAHVCRQRVFHIFIVLLSPNWPVTIHSHYPQVAEMGSNAKKKIWRKTQGWIRWHGQTSALHYIWSIARNFQYLFRTFLPSTYAKSSRIMATWATGSLETTNVFILGL